MYLWGWFWNTWVLNTQPSDDRWDAPTTELPRLRWCAKVQVRPICYLCGSHDRLLILSNAMLLILLNISRNNLTQLWVYSKPHLVKQQSCDRILRVQIPLTSTHSFDLCSTNHISPWSFFYSQISLLQDKQCIGLLKQLILLIYIWAKQFPGILPNCAAPVGKLLDFSILWDSLRKGR